MIDIEDKIYCVCCGISINTTEKELKKLKVNKEEALCIECIETIAQMKKDGEL